LKSKGLFHFFPGEKILLEEDRLPAKIHRKLRPTAIPLKKRAAENLRPEPRHRPEIQGVTNKFIVLLTKKV
jgi:hypothetical protein